MKKLPIVVLSLIGAATLAACGGTTSYTAVAPAPAVAVTAMPNTIVVAVVPLLRPGYGRVESVAPVVYPNGASAGMLRLSVKMDDGSLQVLDTRGPNPVIGERVEITPERYVRYPLA